MIYHFSLLNKANMLKSSCTLSFSSALLLSLTNRLMQKQKDQLCIGRLSVVIKTYPILLIKKLR